MNHFRTVFEEAILEQTETILENEIKKAAADVVTNSLEAMSTITLLKTTTDSSEKDTAQEKILLNMNSNWEEITFLADFLIESIPEREKSKEGIVQNKGGDC